MKIALNHLSTMFNRNPANAATARLSALSFIVLSLFSGAALDSAHAATLVKNVKGYTFDDKGELVQFSSLLMEDGKVLSTYTDNTPAKVTSEIEHTIDGEGKVMLPGLIDAHGHLLGLGANLLEVDLRTSESASDAAKTVAEYAFANNNQPWIMGRGWNQELWSDRAFPSAADLDKVVADRPVFLTRVDGHAAWVNTKAMELAGITKDTPSPVGGEIIKDAAGNPTGVFIDNASLLIESHLPKASNAVFEQQLNAAGKHLLSNGITSMHDAGVGRDVYDFYLKEAVEDDLPVRIYAMVSATDPDLKTMLSHGPIRDSEDFF